MSLAHLLIVLMTLAVSAGCSPREAIPPAANQARPPVENQKLVGKWMRPDGGYVIDLRRVGADGQLEAAYFNPNPINIAQATWRRSDAQALVVFIELRDVNYPGATYRLSYREDDDKLAGLYTQPALDQSFAVEFGRIP